MKKQIVELANAAIPLLDGTTRPMKKILDEHEVVWGVWQDPAEPDGVGMLLIKGHRRLAAIASRADPAPDGTTPIRQGGGEMLKVGAIPFNSFEHAVAAQEVLGESEGTV
jgi:hypothetical protein